MPVGYGATPKMLAEPTVSPEQPHQQLQWLKWSSSTDPPSIIENDDIIHIIWDPVGASIMVQAHMSSTSRPCAAHEEALLLSADSIPECDNAPWTSLADVQTTRRPMFKVVHQITANGLCSTSPMRQRRRLPIQHSASTCSELLHSDA